MAITQLMGYGQGSDSTQVSVVSQYLEHSYTWNASESKHERQILNVIQAPTLEFVAKGSSYTVNTNPTISGYRVKRTAVYTIYADGVLHHRNTNTDNGQTIFTVQDSIIITYYCEAI